MDTCLGSAQVGVDEEEEGAVVGSVGRMAIWPGSVPPQEVATTNAGTAVRRATWLPTVQSRRYVGGAVRRDTWWPSVPSRRPAGGAERRDIRWRNAQSPRSAITVARKDTVPPSVQTLRFAGGARRRGTK